MATQGEHPRMRTRRDQLGKSLLTKALQAAGHVEMALPIVGAPQEGDVAWERTLAVPLLVAFRMDSYQDFVEEDLDMSTLQEMEAIYAEWEQQVLRKGMKEGMKEGRKEGMKEGRKEGHEQGRTETLRQVLTELLAQRFGALPEGAAARIQSAELAKLERWYKRVLSAASIDDVLA